jgi:hypothetical protein
MLTVPADLTSDLEGALRSLTGAELALSWQAFASCVPPGLIQLDSPFNNKKNSTQTNAGFNSSQKNFRMKEKPIPLQFEHK